MAVEVNLPELVADNIVKINALTKIIEYIMKHNDAIGLQIPSQSEIDGYFEESLKELKNQFPDGSQVVV